MSDHDHSTIEERLAVRALGGLDPWDEAALASDMEAHGPCDVCRDLEAGYADTAALLAISLEPVTLDGSEFDRMLAAARAAATPAAAAPAVTDQAVASIDDLARRRSRRGLPVWLAAAAALLLIVISVAVVRPSGATDVSTDWAQRVVRFEGDEGELAMAYVPGEPGVAFWGEGLPDPGPDRTLEIWMIDDGTPIPGGCVAPVEGKIAVFVDANVGTTDTMAVTVEPTSCPREPTSDPVLLAQLS